MFFQLLAVISPVILGVLIGYIWQKMHPQLDTDPINKLIINVGTPCLILFSMSKVSLDITLLGKMITTALLIMFITGVIAWIACRI